MTTEDVIILGLTAIVVGVIFVAIFVRDMGTP